MKKQNIPKNFKGNGNSIALNELDFSKNLEAIQTYDDNGNLNEGVNELNIEELIPNKNQPRKKFDKDALNELAQSISIHGVLQPLLVTKVGNKYQIVAGERRYRASLQAGLKKVPVIIKLLQST